MTRCRRSIPLILLPILAGLILAGAGQLRAADSKGAQKGAISGAEGQINEIERPVQERIERPVEQGNPKLSQQPDTLNRVKSQSKISKSAGIHPKKPSRARYSEYAPAQKSRHPATSGSSLRPSAAPFGSSSATKDSSKPGYGSSGSKKSEPGNTEQLKKKY